MNKINTLELSRVFIIRSPDFKETAIDQVIRSVKNKFPVFDDKNIFEIYHSQFLPNGITLKNGIEYNCSMGNKKIEEFSKIFFLEEQIELYGNHILQDVPFEIKKLISVLLYLYLNKVCILNDLNLLITLNQLKGNNSQKEIFDKYIENLNMIYFQPKNILNTMHFMQLYQYFNKFVIINNKEIKHFCEKADFLAHLE